MMLAAQAANKDESADIPTGNGFCLYIRHDCLQQTGYFREDVFAQGYGEETDFCLRAHALGWKHKVALGVYVAHQGGFSFGEKRLALMERNEDVLEQLHPGYHDAVALWIQKEPLWQAKRRLDIVRFRACTTRQVPDAKMVLLVTHQHGGGIEQVVQRRVAFYKKKSVKSLVFPKGVSSRS